MRALSLSSARGRFTPASGAVEGEGGFIEGLLFGSSGRRRTSEKTKWLQHLAIPSTGSGARPLRHHGWGMSKVKPLHIVVKALVRTRNVRAVDTPQRVFRVMFQPRRG